MNKRRDFRKINKKMIYEVSVFEMEDLLKYIYILKKIGKINYRNLYRNTKI